MAIGRVSATEKAPSTIDQFQFWMDPRIKISPFDIVKVENKIEGAKSYTYGLVQEITHYSDGTSHLGNYVSYDFGDLDNDVATLRLGVTYVTVQVLRNDKDIYMPLTNGMVVDFASEHEIIYSLGLRDIDNPITAGYIKGSNTGPIPICFNKDFLIGPEGAHLNMSGISGLATKTSYIMFLLNALQQKSDNDTAIIVLNVKGDDLLQLDKPNSKITEDQKDDWKKCGLEAKPFENVRYFYPFTSMREETYSNTSLTSLELKNQFETNKAVNYVYTYKNDKSKLDLLFSNVDDPNFTIESIISEIQDNSVFDGVSCWESMLSKIDFFKKKGQLDRQSEVVVQSWKKFGRLIRKPLSNDIFQESLSPNPKYNQANLGSEIENIKSNEVFVVDIAKLDEKLQTLVFGDILRSINALKFNETDRPESDIPKNIIVFVDELNKYAGSRAPKNSPILASLLDITERGRSEGILLFSAEQFKSDIHDRIKGNCSTHIYGRTNAIEISKSDYKYIPNVFKNMMVRLKKGELIVQHAVLQSPLKVNFPYPSYKQGGNNGKC